MSRLLLAVALFLPLTGRLEASTADDLCTANADPCTVSSARTVTPGSILDFGTRQLDVTSTGSITVPSGQLTILAGSVRLESHGKLLGGDTQGNGANIKIVTSGDVRVETGASGDAVIDVSASANPGEIDITAAGAVFVLGQIDSDGTTTQGYGGTINVSADGNLTASGLVSARGGTLGLGGEIFMQAGGSASVPGNVRADGGDGGDIEIDALNGDVSSGGNLDGSAAGTFGDGGSVTLTGSRNLTMSGQVLLAAQGNTVDGGGTGGDAALEATAGSMTVSGTVDNHGASPDGDAGETDMTAGVDYAQSGDVLGVGNGTDGCGGFFDAEIGRTFSLSGLVDQSGGFCGGDSLVDAATATLSATSEFSSDGGDIGGSVGINAQNMTVGGKMHAISTASGSTAGIVQLTGCTLNVPSGAVVRTDGPAGGVNLLQASGQLTVGGQIQSRPAGKNRFEYRDPSKPPITLGSAVVQPTRDCAPAAGCLNSDLPACATSALCGNGIKEPGEDCDDGNAVACDGCSPTCHAEGCGNGTIECGEECDDGFSNGAPGDPCDANCHVVQAANVVFIPGSHHGTSACMLEWAIENAATPGFPSTTQACIDGDPACDADGATDGVCTFHVSACINVTDARLPRCHARPVQYLKVRRPSPIKPNDDVEAADAQLLVSALDGLGPTIKAGDTVLKSGAPDAQSDHCTATFVQRVPHSSGVSGRRLLSAGATDVNGGRISNRMALRCLPNPAVCGNGVVEIGEQCDDGNTTDCDGCSSTCRRERCGDDIVQCSEQCDDGAQNGTPGDPCSATCGEMPPADRIPGGSSTRDCAGEFSLAAGQLATSGSGIPSTRQVCVDGDPSCDFDSTSGLCRLHLWFCLAGDDQRVGCTGTAVASVSLLRPAASQSGVAAAARTAIETALGRLTFPVGPGEVCSQRIDLDLPAGKTKLLLKSEADTTAGFRDRDSLKLSCAPAR